MSRFMNEYDAGNLLKSAGINMVKSVCVKTRDEAEKALKDMKFPLVMKVLSKDIQHKTDAGCVVLGVKDREDGLQAYSTICANAAAYNPQAKIEGVIMQEMAEKGLEVIIGMKHDPQFGSVIMVGTGGIYVEVFKDIALRLLPVSRSDAREMIEETKLSRIISGARGKKYDMDSLVDAIVKLSELGLTEESIEEIDINPFFLYEKGGLGVDALVKLKSDTMN